jgi:uncharacterized protein YeaO (DUF488 family)
VKTAVTSVCSTDIKVFKGHTPVGRYPVVMGHEIAGRVVEVGKEAAGWYDITVDDRITIEPYIACGRCSDSRSDHFYHHCSHGGIYGISLASENPPYLFGGYSEYFYLVPGTIVHKQNENMVDSAASISSVVANGVRWVKTLGKVKFGESVVVSGPGSQGLCSLAAALHSGAEPVVVLGLDCDTDRLQLAREFGAHYVINVDQDDPVEIVFIALSLEYIMTIRIVRLGSARERDEGLRVGTVRRPPRGVRKEDYASKDIYDVWFPNLSPSEALLKEARSINDEKSWKTFKRKFVAEMKQPAAKRDLDLIAALSHQTNFSIGCYCRDESRCHRSILKELLEQRGAQLK